MKKTMPYKTNPYSKKNHSFGSNQQYALVTFVETPTTSQHIASKRSLQTRHQQGSKNNHPSRNLPKETRCHINSSRLWRYEMGRHSQTKNQKHNHQPH